MTGAVLGIAVSPIVGTPIGFMMGIMAGKVLINYMTDTDSS